MPLYQWSRRNFRQLAGMPFPGEDPAKWPPWVPWILAVISVVFWVLFLFGMSESGERAQEIVRRSKPTTGTILEFTDNEARELREARVRYTAAGQEREDLLSVANRKLDEGDTIRLRYDPTDPTVVFEEGDRQPPGGEVSSSVGLFFVGGSVFGLGAAFIWSQQRRAAKVRQKLAARIAEQGGRQ